MIASCGGKGESQQPWINSQLPVVCVGGELHQPSWFASLHRSLCIQAAGQAKAPLESAPEAITEPDRTSGLFAATSLECRQGSPMQCTPCLLFVQ